MEIFGIGPMELILVLIIALMVFGPDKLPEIGAKLGKAMRSMREATHEFSREIEETRQALEAPMQDIKAPFQEASAAVQAISHPQAALREALLGEVNRADDAARQPAPAQEQAGAAAVAATGAALAGAAAATLEDGQPVTENPSDDGAIQADQPALVPAAENPEVATVPVPPSAAPAPVEFSQPAPAAATNFDMDEFVAVMERVSRRLSSLDGGISEPATEPAASDGAATELRTAELSAVEPPAAERAADEPVASAEPAAPAPASGAPEPEDPQSPANPAIEE
jgi:TatA/E family protein of Tat protein translocase